MASSLRFHVPWILWLALICGLCFTPGDQLPQIDWKLISISTCAHFALYFGFIFLLLFGFLSKKKSSEEKKLNRSTKWMYLILVLVSIGTGCFVELIQGEFIYQRYYDPEDMLINTIGTIFGALGYTLIGRKLV